MSFEYDWLKELPKSAVRPTADRSAETVAIAERLIADKEVLKVTRGSKFETRGFTIGLGKALRNRGYRLDRLEDSKNKDIWYLQAKPLSKDAKQHQEQKRGHK